MMSVTLETTQAIAHDENKLIQSTQEAAQELQELFEADVEESERTAVASRRPGRPDRKAANPMSGQSTRPPIAGEQGAAIV